MRTRRCVAALTFVFAYSVQPAALVGCGGVAGRHFDFGQEEMLALIADANATGTWQFQSRQTEFSVELELRPKALVDEPNVMERTAAKLSEAYTRRAHACGTTTRSFSAVASACADEYESTVAVVGKAVVYRHEASGTQPIAEQAIAGKLVVKGSQLKSVRDLTIKVRGETLKLELTRESLASDFVLASLEDVLLGVSPPVAGELSP